MCAEEERGRGIKRGREREKERERERGEEKRERKRDKCLHIEATHLLLASIYQKEVEDNHTSQSFYKENTGSFYLHRMATEGLPTNKKEIIFSGIE